MKRKPEWLRAKLYSKNDGMEVVKLLKSLNLNTVCSEASCPNIGECYGRKTATFMIMGTECTRNCTFCNVNHGDLLGLDEDEPKRIAEAVKTLGLKHVVITSVTRDDLSDGGASHFVKTINAIRQDNRETAIEVLIPDFQGSDSALKQIVDAAPTIINHNMETIARLYDTVRPMADYQQSLKLIEQVKLMNPDAVTKTGIMVGLSETYDEVLALMTDLRQVDCDIITIGQYLAPSRKHIEVTEYIEPEIFKAYETAAYEKGFTYVASGPLVRSSYLADQWNQ